MITTFDASAFSNAGVIVTGGGQGLGRAFCRAFGRHEALVVVADLNLSRAESVADEIRDDGGSACAIQVDVADESSVDQMVAQAVEWAGGLTVLVNNAAFFSQIERRPMMAIPTDEWDRVMAVNVRGAFLASRAVIPEMSHRKYGKIINISSSTIWSGRPGYLHYVTSKAALIGFTRALANEVGSGGICVNAVTPGATKTEVERRTVSVREWDAIIARSALGRQEGPDDLVGTVLFLASHASDFITGQTVNVDGGTDFH